MPGAARAAEGGCGRFAGLSPCQEPQAGCFGQAVASPSLVACCLPLFIVTAFAHLWRLLPSCRAAQNLIPENLRRLSSRARPSISLPRAPWQSDNTVLDSRHQSQAAAPRNAEAARKVLRAFACLCRCTLQFISFLICLVFI